MSSKAVISRGSTEIFTGDATRPVVTLYRVVDPDGEHGEVFYKGYYTALESLLDDQGIGDDLLDLLRDADCYLDFILGERSPADCFHANQGEVDEILARHGYRIDSILKLEVV